MRRCAVLSGVGLGLTTLVGCASGPSSPADRPAAFEDQPAEARPARAGDQVTIGGRIASPGEGVFVGPVEIRYDENGAMAFRTQPVNGRYLCEALPPHERYRVTAEFGYGPSGPWFYPARVVESGDGTQHRIDFALPAGDSELVLEVSPDTQPFYFALYPPETEPPADRAELESWFRTQYGHKSPFFLIISPDGSVQSRMPRIPAGRYLAVAQANDWEVGDPPVAPRSAYVTLSPRTPLKLRLEQRLRFMTIVDEAPSR